MRKPEFARLGVQSRTRAAGDDQAEGGVSRAPALRHGFTLVETMIVAICLAILLGPIFLLLRSGSRRSLEGMLRIDTTLEARRVLQQIHADLKQACLPIVPQQPVGFTDFLFVTGSVPEWTYTFLSYPLHRPVTEIVPNNSGNAPRRAARITYRVVRQNDPNKPFLRLYRDEEFPGSGKQTRTLSDRVNFFEIKPLEIQAGGRNQFYFWINLQLVDTAKGVDTTAMAAGTPVTAAKAGVLLADFFDVVYPEFFHAFWNHPMQNPNWHAGLISP
jgi:type II secretory pathway pseudopilin PulG